MYTKKIFVIPFNLCTWICNTTVNFRIHIDINKIHRKAKDIEDLIIYIDYGLDSFVAKKLAGKQYRVNFSVVWWQGTAVFYRVLKCIYYQNSDCLSSVFWS